MKIASITEIKKELVELPPEALMNICLKLAKYKKDNKELLNYILFESDNETGYIEALKLEMAEEFANINISSMYLAKKSIRRIHRLLVKHIRYSGNKQTEIELLLDFCQHLRTFSLPIVESKAMINLYERQVKNIKKALATLDEDLQFDYLSAVQEVGKPIS